MITLAPVAPQPTDELPAPFKRQLEIMRRHRELEARKNDYAVVRMGIAMMEYNAISKIRFSCWDYAQRPALDARFMAADDARQQASDLIKARCPQWATVPRYHTYTKRWTKYGE